jgi:hypothetical protein
VANDPKKFRIPREFTLFGHQYVVLIEEDLFEKENCYGIADDDLKRIRIQKKKRVFKLDGFDKNKKRKKVFVELTDEVIIETFYHELSHIILDAIGEEKLSHNEKLVNMIGKSLLEIYLTSKFEKA